MNKWSLALLLTLGVVLPAQASLRCGNSLIRVGDTRGSVMAKCGEPSEVYTRPFRLEPEYAPASHHPARHHSPRSGPVVEFWIYNFGPDRFMQRLRFEDGVLVRVKRLARGYEEPAE